MEYIKMCREWDMAWFCDGCGAMKGHWEKGWLNLANGDRYCSSCKEKIDNGEKVGRNKGLR